MSQCDAFGLLPGEAAAEVARVIDVVNVWQEHFAQTGVTQRDIESLAERIDGDALRAQRTDFDQAGYQSTPAKRKLTSPFRHTSTGNEPGA
jgi:serine/threonine-protein kinase HipA